MMPSTAARASEFSIGSTLNGPETRNSIWPNKPKYERPAARAVPTVHPIHRFHDRFLFFLGSAAVRASPLSGVLVFLGSAAVRASPLSGVLVFLGSAAVRASP